MCVCLNVVVNKRDDDHSVLWILRNRVKTSKHKNTNTKIYIYEHDHSFHSWKQDYGTLELLLGHRFHFCNLCKIGIDT